LGQSSFVHEPLSPKACQGFDTLTKKHVKATIMKVTSDDFAEETCMLNQAGNSRFDTVLKLLMISFVFLLAFSAGVFFGKEMTENDYQLKALESDFISAERKVASKAKSSDSLEEEEDLSQEEVAAVTEKFLKKDGKESKKENKEKSVQAIGKTETLEKSKRKVASQEVAATEQGSAKQKDVKKVDESKAVGTAGKPDLSGVREAVRKVTSSETRTEIKPEMKPEMKSLEPSNSMTEFTVQVASYKELAEAKKHADELTQKGFPAFPVQANVKGQTWYRVTVGSFRTAGEAGRFRTQLIKQTGIPTAIIQRVDREPASARGVANESKR